MEHDPEVRGSTINALKLSCPSAELLDSATSVKPMDNPFGDADAEWSDEEELLPKNRRKTHYVPPQKFVSTVSATETWVQPSSSGSSSPHEDSEPTEDSPPLPLKSPSRSASRGSSHNDLLQRYYQISNERDALRKELQRRSMGPHGIPSRVSVVFKSEEKTLIEEIQTLRYEIRSWSEEYFSGPLTSRSKRPHLHSAKELFGKLTEDHNAYVKHHEERPLLIQAYVWNKLQQRIFSTLLEGSGYVWAGKLGDRKLRPINDTLRRAVKNEEQAAEYHRWRATTVNMLVPQIDGKWRPTFDAEPVLKRISRFCSKIRRRLRPYSTQSLRHGKDRLHTIVSAAVALDLKMKRQLADYRFVTFTGGRTDEMYGFGYYDSEMEDIDDSLVKSRRVEISLAPALERCGNANGHIFENSYILLKAEVSCKRLEKQRPPRAGKPPGSRGGIRSVMSFWNN